MKAEEAGRRTLPDHVQDGRGEFVLTIDLRSVRLGGLVRRCRRLWGHL